VSLLLAGRPTGTVCYPYGFADILPRRGSMEDLLTGELAGAWNARAHTHTPLD